MTKRYYQAGEKTVTVRWDDPVTVGPATFVFEDHPDNPRFDGEVIAVERHRLDTLTAEQARMPNGGDITALVSGLRAHYPEMPEDALVDVVTFAISKD